MTSRCSKPSTFKCRVCGKNIEWKRMKDVHAGFAYKPFDMATGFLHRDCGAGVKIYSKKEREAFAKSRGVAV